MGVGSSRERYEAEPLPKRRSPVPKRRRHGKKKRRRGFFRKIRRVPTTLPIIPIIPIKPHHPYRYSYGLRPLIPPISPYASLPPPLYPRYMPMSYNNYAAPYYIPQYQPMMVPPQQIYPMAMPQQVPQSQPMMMQQPMMMPQQVPYFQPMVIPQQISPPMYSPYMSPPYSMGVPYSTPYSTPYSQQQPQVQPVYNNIGVSPPVSTGMTGQNRPYSSPYLVTNIKITDWTGGGKISPGFLGPPI